MSKSKAFHIGDILSVTTGYLLAPSHMEGVYAILNFMTNDNLFTHQLPRASKECQPFLLEQMPWLADISAEGVTKENFETWLNAIVQKYGETHEVKPLPVGSHLHIDPITELVQILNEEVDATIAPE
ncbi:MAG TPA: hypothetical protein VJY47_02105 [Candidatus Dojkabacteria bacterium]|nr:hypothetical protein [Candidatus Dojkabacteria bacterium]